jgi:ribosomal protein RSM22 (predicted rRNA methylase)
MAMERALARVVGDVPPGDLAAAAADLSARYRSGAKARPLQSDAEALAYLATRLPATAAAAASAFQAVAALLPGFSPLTHLDIGAGPGAAAWAAQRVWPAIAKVRLFDRDRRQIEAGRRLRQDLEGDWQWIEQDLAADTSEFAAADLVTASYALGELAPEAAFATAVAAWGATKGCLVIVEPGTPVGFALVRQLRAHLLAAGALLIAPCPHEGECPVTGDDWCHFAARVSRSAVHRRLKGGDLAYEDEKFSYVAFTRLPGARAKARLVRRPARRRRLVQLVACEGDSLVSLAFGQSRPGYRAAADLAWGDAIPPELLEET